MKKLEGKKALVTGAGSGLGKAIAISLAAEGATVVLTGRREEKLREVAKEIGDSAIVIPADVTSELEVNNLFDKIKENTGGKLDILVNNVGGINAMGTISEMSLEDWNRMNDLNLTSQFLVTKHALPVLRESETAKLVSVTSGMVNFFVDGMGSYSASKAAVEALMKTVAVEEKENGIQVNLFDPINAITDANPQGQYEPMELVKTLVDLVSSDSVIRHGEVVKPEM